MTVNNSPIILCHAACSGGSVIFRKICQEFGLIGISEVCPQNTPVKNRFIPFDPEVLMYLGDWISEEDFEAIFAQRLRNCKQVADSHGRTLLVREHTHSLFFDARFKVPESGFSWTFDRSNDIFDSESKVIISVRDPIDSWLGLKFHFRVGFNFDEYCKRYIHFFEQVLKAQSENDSVAIVKYEDFIADAESVFETIGSSLGIQRSESKAEPQVMSSGNSGRQSDKLSKRSRRGFSLGFIRAVESSTHYRPLVDLLGYEDCSKEFGMGTRISATINSLRKFAVAQGKKLFGGIKSAGQKASVAD